MNYLINLNNVFSFIKLYCKCNPKKESQQILIKIAYKNKHKKTKNK
jgi:hypothetical protein